MDKEYHYILKKKKADGTVVEYPVTVPYTTKPKKKEQYPAAEIKSKINLGIPKKRICTDYKISYHVLQQILSC